MAVSAVENKARSNYLMEGWKSRISKMESVAKSTGKSQFAEGLNYDRKLNLAYAFNTTRKMRDYHESIQTADAGIFKNVALDIVGPVVVNLLCYDIVSVQPIDSPVGMVRFFEYQYGTSKGSTQAGTAFADNRNFYQSDALYSTDKVSGETVEAVAGTAQAFTVRFFPIITGAGLAELPLKVKIGSVVFTDAGNGILTSAVAGNSGTVDYITGDITLTLASAASAGDPITIDYTYALTYVDDTASSRNIPEVLIKPRSIPVIAKPRRMKAVWSFDFNFMMSKEYDQEVEALLNATVASEIWHEIDSEVINDLYTMASAGNEIVWDKTITPGISKADHYDSFSIALDECSENIQQATRKVSANFAVGGVSVGTVVSKIKGFVPELHKTTAGPYLHGTLPNGMKFYVDQNLPKNVGFAGYKGDTLFDTGYILAMYMPVMTLPMAQLEDMAGRKGWAASYGKARVNRKMYNRFRITGQA